MTTPDHAPDAPRADEALPLTPADILELDGAPASPAELERARQTVAVLRRVLEDTSDEAAAAQLLHEIALVLGRPLGDRAEALATAREAFRRKPDLPHVARGYRTAALRAGSVDDLVAALEGEAAAVPADRAALHGLRAELLERRFANPVAARAAYAAALDQAPADVAALGALERVAVAEKDWAAAASYARRLAEAATDPALRAEHGARAARRLEAAGDAGAAAEAAAQAQVRAPAAPSVQLVLERLWARGDRIAELVALREDQIARGAVTPAVGWFEIGVLAAYRLRDLALATRAFGAAAETADAPSRAVILGELAAVLTRAQDWERLVGVEEARIGLEAAPAGRASGWHRVALLCEERLHDDERAARAYEQALAEAPTYVPAFEGAGRVYQRLGTTDRLLKMHQLEAANARTPTERAVALRRAGELLIEDPARVAEGITALAAAYAELPGNLAVFCALERAYRRQQAWPELIALYDAEVGRTAEPRRRAWLLTQIGTIAADRLADRPRAIRAFMGASEHGDLGALVILERLAELLEESGEPGELSDVLSRLAALAGEPAQVASTYERVAAVLERRGLTDQALAAYLKAIAVAPVSHPVYAAAGRAFARAGRYAEVAELYDAATTQGEPTDRARWLCRAADVRAGELRQVDEAVRRYRTALELCPGYLAAVHGLAQLLTTAERWEELGAVLDSSGRDDPAALVRRAAIAEALGDALAACDLYGQALGAGVTVAAGPYARLLGARGDWPELYRLTSAAAAALPEGPARARARYGAAEVLLERLGGPAGEELVRALTADASGLDLSCLVLLQAAAAGRPEVARVVCAELDARVSDLPTRVAALRSLAAALDELGEAAAAATARRRLLAFAPVDPLATVGLELALEAQNDREGLRALWRTLATDPQAEGSPLAAALAALAPLHEELGSLQEAADAWEGALRRQPRPAWVSARIALPRLYQRLGDGPREVAALRALGEALPAGAERAACMRALAQQLTAANDPAGAIAAYEAALQAWSGDHEALAELARLLDQTGEHQRLIGHLQRAFAAEDRPTFVATIGVTLALRLLRARQAEPARVVIERVLAVTPGNLRALLVAVEAYTALGAWIECVAALELLAAPAAAAPPTIRVQALIRMGTIQATRLADRDGLLRSAAQLRALPADPATLTARLQLEELCADPAGLAEVLRALVALPGLSEEQRTEYLLRLAAIQEEQLGDAAGAIASLAAVTGPTRRRDAVERLLALGDTSGRWDLAASALEAALDGGGAMETGWEIAIRLRLAKLLDGPLERHDAATRQFERVVALDPQHLEALERLAESAGDAEPAKAVEHHRALLARVPDRIESYRALRQLFLKLEDEDAAFCAEAVLEGLGHANEEESYFYRQRRARLTGESTGALTEEDRRLICPEIDEPAWLVLEAMAPVLHRVFPVDYESYGVPAVEEEPAPTPLRALAYRAARLLGVPAFRVALVGTRLGPAIEVGDPPLLLLPRSLEEAPRREQLFVCGSLLGRAAFGGILGDPRRVSPTPPAELEYLLWSVCEVVGDAAEAPARGKPVYEDIKRRVQAALGASARAALVATAPRLLERPAAIDGASLSAAFQAAALRAGMIAAQDPAVALAAGRGPGTPPDGLASGPFAVSAGFLALRRRLLAGVRPC